MHSAAEREKEATSRLSSLNCLSFIYGYKYQKAHPMYSKVDDELPSGTLTQTFHQLPPLVFFFSLATTFQKAKKKTCIFRTNCPSQRFRSLFFLFFQPCSSLLASSFFFSVVSFINFIFRSFEGGNHPSRSPDVIQSLARVTLLRFPKLRMTDASERRHKRKDRLEIHRLECFYLLFSTCAYTHTMAIHPRAWP